MNEQLDELEEQLEVMSKQKLYFMYVSIVSLLIYLSWNLFGENLASDIELKNNSILSLEKKLKKNNVKLIKKAIKKTTKEKLIVTSSFEDLKSKEMYISSKLDSMDFIFFNQKGIAKILDDILKQSLKYSIDIDKIVYDDVDKLYTSNIYEKENIIIKGSASFSHIMNLMQYIDSIKSLLQINGFDIYLEKDNSLNFDINISNYGVKF